MVTTPIFLVSACLLGVNARYDGQCKLNKQCLKRIQNAHIVPICPEQLGGLRTPRHAAKIIGGDGNDVLEGKAKVITLNGQDVSSNFIQGAQQVLKIIQLQQNNGVFFKSRSPSCGVTTLGVTAALLKKHGYDLYEF